MKNSILKIVTLLVVLNVVLLGNSSSKPVNVEIVEVGLDSFSILGTVVMIVLSSLLGAFFIKDEFA